VTRVYRWKPPVSWCAYTAPGLREYRSGFYGHLWAAVPADTARVLLPWLDGRALPDAASGGLVPDEAPGWYAARLDCRGRLGRLLGSAAELEDALTLCGEDAVDVCGRESEYFGRTGRRPPWARVAPGGRLALLDEEAETLASGPANPVVLRTAALTWPLRRLADTLTLTRRARLPRGLAAFR
jgi:hypothetical protein